MEMRDYIVIGGVIIGFLILIYGILVLRKMKKEEQDTNNVTEEVNNNQVNQPEPSVASNENSFAKDETKLNENPSIIGPEDDASDLFKSENNLPDEADTKILNNVQLSNSSLDSEIVSKPSLETEEDFLENKPVELHEDEKVVQAEIPAQDKTENIEVNELPKTEEIKPIQNTELPREDEDNSSDIESLF